MIEQAASRQREEPVDEIEATLWTGFLRILWRHAELNLLIRTSRRCLHRIYRENLLWLICCWGSWSGKLTKRWSTCKIFLYWPFARLFCPSMEINFGHYCLTQFQTWSNSLKSALFQANIGHLFDFRWVLTSMFLSSSSCIALSHTDEFWQRKITFTWSSLSIIANITKTWATLKSKWKNHLLRSTKSQEMTDLSEAKVSRCHVNA